MEEDGGRLGEKRQVVNVQRTHSIGKPVTGDNFFFFFFL